MERQRNNDKQSSEGVKTMKTTQGLAPRNLGKKRDRKKQNELLMECGKLMIDSGKDEIPNQLLLYKSFIIKFTSWNIRGLGSKRKQRILSNRMKQEAPDMIFIQETKCSIQKIKEIHSKWLNRFEFLEVKVDNIVGGVLTLWNPQNLGIIDAEASRNYLSVVIYLVRDRDIYLVTNVYGPQRIDDKIKFLDSLVDLRDKHVRIPWIMGGGFNMITSLSEKKGEPEL